MKQSTKPSFHFDGVKDEIIIKLFNSYNSDDWKLASIYVVQKYKYQSIIDEFFRKNIGYRVRDTVKYKGKLGLEFEGKGKVYVYVDRKSWLQIVVGNYGLWCKSLRFEPLINGHTVIEEI